MPEYRSNHVAKLPLTMPDRSRKTLHLPAEPAAQPPDRHDQRRRPAGGRGGAAAPVGPVAPGDGAADGKEDRGCGPILNPIIAGTSPVRPPAARPQSGNSPRCPIYATSLPPTA